MNSSTGEEGNISPEQAFSLLADETRLAILRTLWTAETPIRFSALRERIEHADSGNFNYHLRQLANHFVRRTPDGYELRHAGKEVVRAVLAGALTDDTTIDTFAVDGQCGICGASVEAQYEHELLTIRCTNCEGVRMDTFPRGTLGAYELPAVGLRNRSPEEVFPAAFVWFVSSVIALVEGVCPRCTGKTGSSVSICREHSIQQETVCDACESVFSVWAEYECRACGFTQSLPAQTSLIHHPAVISFYYDRGVEINRLWELIDQAHYLFEWETTVLSEDPLEIQYSIPFDDEELHVTMDEGLTVIDVRSS